MATAVMLAEEHQLLLPIALAGAGGVCDHAGDSAL